MKHDVSYRFNCPVDVVRYLGEIRLGGWRLFDHSQYPQFQLIIYAGERIIIGLCVNDHYDAPFVAPWLESPSFRAMYEALCLAPAQQNQRKLNLARWAMCQAICSALRQQDPTVVLTPRHHVPRPDDSSQVLSAGDLMNFLCIQRFTVYQNSRAFVCYLPSNVNPVWHTD